jgi:phage antirepressor YoqD-like protein
VNEVEKVSENLTKTMSVKQVSIALGISERAIQERVKEIYPELVSNGRPTLLLEHHVTEIKKAIEKGGRSDLAQVRDLQNINTDLEMKQKAAEVMAWLMRDNEQLKARNAELEPKAAFFDQVADSKTALQMRDIAATLNVKGYGRNNLFQFLRDRGILDSRNIPYRQYQDAGYFRVVEQSYTDQMGESHVTLKTLVYQRGLEYIRKVIEKYGA